MTTTTATFDRVYIWEAPVRLYHWVTAVSMATLGTTGLLIGHPLAFMTTGDASAGFWFGTVRFLHFAAGFVFMFALVIRVYWMFAGNRYAKWSNFFPLTPTLYKKELAQVAEVVKTDLLQVNVPALEVRGHNSLAAWSYSWVFALSAFQIVTGLALYAPMSTLGWPSYFAWVVPLLGGDASVRMWHHLVTWCFAVFVLVHVYLTLYHDYVEGEGEISSMVSGSKFFRRHDTR
jgi:Ni/Fe-hydrogenase 1 B-type cytochrome subunit